MDYTLMYPAGRLIELRTREHLIWDWERHVPEANRCVPRGGRAGVLLARAVAGLKAAFRTGTMREAHA